MRKCHTLDNKQKENIQREIKECLKNENKIVFVYIHGSFLKSRFRDIDIGIYLNVTPPKKKVLEYELVLEDRLSRNLSYPCDVRVLNRAPLSFRFSVIKHNVLLFSKDECRRADFECLSLVEYHDFDIYRNRYLRDALGIKV